MWANILFSVSAINQSSLRAKHRKSQGVETTTTTILNYAVEKMATIQEHIMSSYLPANAGVLEEDSWGIFAIPAINLGSGVSPRVFHRF